MNIFVRICEAIGVLLFLFSIKMCDSNVFQSVDKQYHLVSEAFNVAKDLFLQGRANYNMLKNKSLEAMDTFLDLVEIMNNEMARELRSAVVKFYRIKYFRDFTNYVISMEEMIDVTEHCLMEPIEKIEQVRNEFRHIIGNFEDVRKFSTVDKCRDQLPDEVAAAHCMLHQAVLFNETMQETLVSIVEIKTRQHAQDMNTSISGVQKCFNYFVPKFFEQLLVDAYTDNCGYLKVVNASVADLSKDKWKNNETRFPKKWSPLLNLLKRKLKPPKRSLQESLFLTLFAANLSSPDVIKTLYTTTL